MPPTGSPVEATELAQAAKAGTFTDLPGIYPPEVRGDIPASARADEATQRVIRSTVIPASAMTASFAAGAYTVVFGTPVTRLRIAAEAGLSIVVGWGRPVSLEGYDDRVTFLTSAPAEHTIEVPAGRHFTFGNIAGAGATLPVLVIGLNP
jgi:hypothetical protein